MSQLRQGWRRKPSYADSTTVTVSRSLGHERANHSLALIHGGRFELADFHELLHDAVHHLLALVDVGQLAATKDDRDDDLVFVFEKALGLLDLEIDVVVARLGAQADFLRLDVMRGLMGLLLFLVLIFAEIHDSANTWPLVGRNLDQIKVGFPGLRNRLIDRQNSELFTSRSNNSHRRNANLFIDPSRNPLCDWSSPFLFENKSPVPGECLARTLFVLKAKTEAQIWLKSATFANGLFVG